MAGEELVKYGELLRQLKEKIKAARQKAILVVNNELLTVYWEIGNAISEQEQETGWGGKIVDKLAADLKAEFPEMKGLSPRNLRYMRDFALAYPAFLQQAAAKMELPVNEEDVILQQLAAKLPWGHHQTLLTRLKTREERSFYIHKAVENGWSRSILEHQIESGLYKTQGTLVNNFNNTLPAYQSELTQQVFKDPYNFDFIMLGEQARERDLEEALMKQVTKVLLELGVGFAFMGRQKRFEAGGRDFFFDLLFYHTKLRRHIIIELKIGEFEAEFVSKMNLYLGLADDQLKGEFDEPAIGLILCKTNNKIVAEYSLRDTGKPIGIAEYKIAERLPENIKGELPSIEEIEQRIDEEIKEAISPVDKRLLTIKEKLKNLTNDEIQTSATPEILTHLYQTGIHPLYEELIQRMVAFKEYFYSQSLYWYCPGNSFKSLEEVDTFWRVEENIRNIFEFNCVLRLDGLKKAGTENCNSSETLAFKIDTYHYGFTLVKHNNQQPFFKKLYHQPLTPNDRREIIDVIIGEIINDIEKFLERK